MKFGLMSYNDHWTTERCLFGQEFDLDIVFLKLQISEVMANYHWDDFFACFVIFQELEKTSTNRGSDPKPHDGNTFPSCQDCCRLAGDFLFGYTVYLSTPLGQKGKNLWRIRNIDWPAHDVFCGGPEFVRHPWSFFFFFFFRFFACETENDIFTFR